MTAPTDPQKALHMFSDDMKFLQKAVVMYDGKFLALRRSMSDIARPGSWDLPGGNVHFGENHEESLKREIKEETQIEVTNLKPLQVVTNFVDGTYYLFIGYTAEAVSDKVTLSHEHSEYRWVTKEEFLSLNSADFLVDLVSRT